MPEKEKPFGEGPSAAVSEGDGFCFVSGPETRKRIGEDPRRETALARITDP